MILDPEFTTAYIVLAIALAIAPSPNVLFVIANGMQNKIKGVITSAIGLTFLLCVSTASGKASDWLNNTHLGRWLDGFAGLCFIGLACRLALAEKPSG